MANSIATAVAYINNDKELESIYNANSNTADWVKPNVAVGAKTVKYRQTSFKNSTLGTFNRATGYAQNDITSTWVEKSLSQDKGDSLSLDKMDAEEAQALEIASLANKYIRQVQIPSVDTYRFSAVVGTTGVKKVTGTLTKANVADAIDEGLAYLKNLRVGGAVTLHISVSAFKLLSQDARAKGYIALGTWNGDASLQVRLYGDTLRAKVIEVPDDEIGCDFILAPIEAVAAMVKYQENEYFDKIPNFGGRKAQVDIGIYHDCWVEPGAEKFVYVHSAS